MDVEFVQSPDDLHAPWRDYLLRIAPRRDRRKRSSQFRGLCIPGSTARPGPKHSGCRSSGSTERLKRAGGVDPPVAPE